MEMLRQWAVFVGEQRARDGHPDEAYQEHASQHLHSLDLADLLI
jgi:hypothetical protein